MTVVPHVRSHSHPKIDRVACPWLIARFIDKDPEFIFVPAADVETQAVALGAVPFDVEGVELTHDGPRCSFDAFLAKYQLGDDALRTIATIVRGADTARLDLAPQAAGLLSISLGLSRMFPNDHEMLRHGFVIYDALYAWCREAADETQFLESAANGWRQVNAIVR
ncbi:MAG TPA: chromate resistance protein ChrB domain-containing protein [Gemmatimonadaceae bacterium]|nr:chromate resistance protein ChrB domain-containing protein [Gemmatimonadaceae bacterium]